MFLSRMHLPRTGFSTTPRQRGRALQVPAPGASLPSRSAGGRGTGPFSGFLCSAESHTCSAAPVFVNMCILDYAYVNCLHVLGEPTTVSLDVGVLARGQVVGNQPQLAAGPAIRQIRDECIMLIGARFFHVWSHRTLKARTMWVPGHWRP